MMDLTLEHIAFYTFRQLSATTKRYISVERVAWVLRHKFDYLSGLTYKQKCTVSLTRIVEVVQRRLANSGMYVSKALIRLILQAEELCYAQLFIEETQYEVEEEAWQYAA